MVEVAKLFAFVFIVLNVVYITQAFPYYEHEPSLQGVSKLKDDLLVSILVNKCKFV